MNNKRIKFKTIEIVEKKYWVGTFKENKTYTENGIELPYRPRSYCSHEKGSKMYIPFSEILPKYITGGDFRESVLHKVPTKDLDWHAEWRED